MQEVKSIPNERQGKLSDSILWQQQFQEKREEIWLNPMTKPPTPTEESKKQREIIKTPVTAVTTLVWLNLALNLPNHRKSSAINRTWHDRNIVNNNNEDFHKDGYMLKGNQKSNETLSYNMTVITWARNMLKIKILKIEMYIRLHGSCGTD